MSRNRTLRSASDKLPVMYKVDNKGNPLYDNYGIQIPVDHFQEMLKLKYKHKLPYDIKLSSDQNWANIKKHELQLAGEYALQVKETYEHMQRKKRIRIYKIALSIISFSSLAIYIWIKYF